MAELEHRGGGDLPICPCCQGLSVLREGSRQSWVGLMGKIRVSVGHQSDVLRRLSLRLISSIRAMQKRDGSAF